MNDRLAELCVYDTASGRLDLPQHAEGETFAVVAQRAQIARQEGGHHVNALIDEIDGGAAALGLVVERRAGPNEVRHVGYVHAALVVAVGQQDAVERVVYVRAAGRIDGADALHAGEIASLGALLVANRPGHGGQAVDDRLRERIVGHVVFEQQHLVLGRLVADGAERAHEMAERVARVTRPTVDVDHDALVGELGRLARLHAYLRYALLARHEQVTRRIRQYARLFRVKTPFFQSFIDLFSAKK